MAGEEGDMAGARRVWAVVGAGCLVAAMGLPVSAGAAEVAPSQASGGPTAPAPPAHRKPPPVPKPKPKPPPPPASQPTTWPVHAGDRGPLVTAVQQRLVWLGYRVRINQVMDRSTVLAVSTFRAKFGLGTSGVVTTATWKRLSALTHTHGVLPAACRTAAVVLCIDKTQKSLRLVRRGVVALTVDARFGGPRTPTREGTFRVNRKSRDHVSTLFHTSMPYAMFFAGGQAVHYSPYFHRDGYNGASHGCVNLRDLSAARWLFGQVPMGTRVVVYRS